MVLFFNLLLLALLGGVLMGLFNGNRAAPLTYLVCGLSTYGAFVAIRVVGMPHGNTHVGLLVLMGALTAVQYLSNKLETL